MAKVIVIDDDPDSAAVFGEYLKIKGIDVLGYGNNGQQAVELYKRVKPDLVLMDLVMTDYDGYYGLLKIKEFDPSAKIIMVTGSVTPSGANILQKHASGVIIKPFEIETVLETIDRVMGISKKPLAQTGATKLSQFH